MKAVAIKVFEKHYAEILVSNLVVFDENLEFPVHLGKLESKANTFELQLNYWKNGTCGYFFF